MYSDSNFEIFNTGWKFISSHNNNEADSTQIVANALTIDLPHSWNAQGWNYEKWSPDIPSGTGWYYTYLPELSADFFYSLKFDGISAYCEVYLNGKRIKENLGAHKSFEAELDGLKGDGTDLVAVKVIDKPSLPKLSCEPNDPFASSPRYKSWITPIGSSLFAGGIWRNVWLVKRDKCYMKTPVIRVADNTVNINTTVTGSDYSKLKYEVFDESGNMVVTSEADSNGHATLTIADVKPWHPHSPTLYSLQSSLINDGGKVIQQIRQPLAFFEFNVRDSEFFVNGRPYFLRGQNGFPHCNIAYDSEYIEKYVSRVKSQGVEISRFHTEPPSHAWLDECDRQGIMVILEMPLHGSHGCYAYGNPEFAKNALSEIMAVIEEYRRHPSIAMWSLGNEMIVAAERDIGLGPALFDVLENWCAEVRKLDHRPIIANSGGDAVDLVPKTVGDVDDVHQYGGWYTENLRELEYFNLFAKKNDMVFQPMISTESVAAYTDNDGQFLINDASDVRQRKVVNMRMGKINDLRKQSLDMQALLLKEYAEAMWRLRRPDSRFAGYIPFGQYTWFFNPFDKSENGLQDKPTWEMYRKVMGPVHVQFECWNRHIEKDAPINGRLLVCHEDISLPEQSKFSVEIRHCDRVIFQKEIELAYHNQFHEDLSLPLPEFANGENRLIIIVRHNGKLVAENYLTFRIYEKFHREQESFENVYIYDPAAKLDLNGAYLRLPNEICNYPAEKSIFIIGPYSLDAEVAESAAKIREWAERGGKIVVLEQNPGPYSENILGTGTTVFKKNQPYWSRWAANLVKHADRADICDEKHPMFSGLSEKDINWWNEDTYVAHNYLAISENHEGDRVLSRIGNGLSPDELMPVQYKYVDSGYSITAVEFTAGKGKILILSLLIGSKLKTEPVARKMLQNLL